MSDIITCPYCDRKLRIPAELAGKPVKCPSCLKNSARGSRGTVAGTRAGHRRTRSSPRTRAQGQRHFTPDQETRSGERTTRNRVKEDEDDDDYPRRRSRRYADYDEEEDDYPRRRRKRYYEEHRGSMIMALGIGALMGFFTPITGPMAWIMGNSDLDQMRRGKMDPEGETLTRVGKNLGMAATILMLLFIVLFCGLISMAISTG